MGRDRKGAPHEEADQGTVVERIKGGSDVDIGAQAFLPGSQVDLRPVRNLDGMKGQEIEVARHQAEQEARQHRGLAQAASGRGSRTRSDPRPWSTWKKARS